MIFKNTLRLLKLASLAFLFNIELMSQESVIEDIIVTAEKRDEPSDGFSSSNSFNRF